MELRGSQFEVGVPQQSVMKMTLRKKCPNPYECKLLNPVITPPALSTFIINSQLPTCYDV